MSTNGAFLPGTMFLIDTSAAARMRIAEVRRTIEGVVDAGMAATCVTVDLEAGFSARKGGDISALHAKRASVFVTLEMNEAIAIRARSVQALLGQRGLHRGAGVVDLLTAAIGEHYRAIVLHYDADFDQIASVTGQQVQWIAPRGSLD